MKKLSLNKHCQNFYQNQELSQHKLDQLIELSESINNKQYCEPPPSQKTNFTWRSVAAAAFVTVILSFGVQQLSVNNGSGIAHMEIVPQEIALNHSKHLALEFNSNNYPSLNKMMAKLDFELKTSNNIHLDNLTIQGSRYCSIQGNLAAQIRLIDNKKNTYTLYQTPLTTALMSEKPSTFVTNGIIITQWQENDLFFGLAQTTAIRDIP